MTRSRRAVGITTALTLAAGLLAALPAAPAAADRAAAPKDPDRVVAGGPVKARPRVLDASVARPAPPPVVRWPEAGVVEGSPQASPGLSAGASRDAGGKGPLRISGAARARVLDRAAVAGTGLDGVVFALEQPAGDTVDVRLDYSGFAAAYGGDYGSRLRLVGLPACALTTPGRDECRTIRPLTAVNDTAAATLSAQVPAAETVLAATAQSGGEKGDYKATSLAASDTWQVGAQSGDFTWSYPMRMPPVPGGLTPSVALSYSSASIDGRTSNGNSQPSWVGDGFELWPGYIERRYNSCEDDKAPKNTTWNIYPGDLCWGYDNATLSLNGKGGELIPAGDGTWRTKGDDGTRVERLTGSGTANGDDDGEYWKVTTTDGTQYFFGLNTLAAGKPQTKSAWTVPVFGDDDGEPCHKSDFKDSWCQQAWRWNLDKVVDTDGNAVVYFYEQERNHYGRNLKAEDETPYVRGGHLRYAEYGLRAGDLFPTPAPARVEFTTAERCMRETASDCAEAEIKDHPDYWQDVPWDLHCDEGQKCEEDHGTGSPTFWSRKRLVKVTTKVAKADGSGHRAVDSWTLQHAWGMADVDRQLLLTSVVHTGHAGVAPVTLPPVSFVYTQLPNRVDKLGDDLGPFVKNRLGTIYNEYGGVLDVNYSAADCTTSDLPSPQTNRRRCFPVYWMKTSGVDDHPTLDWFHKYVVTQTVQTDLTGGAPDQVTAYDYSIGRPAWHFDDDDGLTPEKYKTWSQWHGYDKVRVISGATGPNPGQVDHWYFQGMDGDRLGPDGGRKDVDVSDGEGGSSPDSEALQGFEVRKVTYDRAGGTPVEKVVTSPWYQRTASRTRSWGTVSAYLSAPRTTRTLTALDGGRWRESKTANLSFDEVTGRVLQVDDQGDVALDTDDVCTTTTMAARNTGAWLVDAVAEELKVARRCGAAVDYTKDLVSATRTAYDGGAYRQAPSKGRATSADKASAGGTTAAALAYVSDTRTSHDAYGRPTTVVKIDHTSSPAVERPTTTVYTDTQGLNTRTAETGPPATPGVPGSAMTTAKDLDPAWGSAVTTTDAGGKTVTMAYDALGRLVKVWTPARGTGQVPDREYAYRVAAGQITAVTTKKLDQDGGQETSVSLLDGWLRARQTQDAGPGGGRLVSDTFYNAQGAVDRTYAPYFADGPPAPALFGVAQTGQVETQTVYTYDGRNRKTAEILRAGNSDTGELWRTTFAYGGDWSRVTPPSGGVVTTTVTDARGRRSELRRHRPDGGYDSTFYTYTGGDRPAEVKGPGGHVWRYTYDVRGRKTSELDPDKGLTTFAYDDLDRLVQSVDARGQKLTLTLDGLGRKTAQYDGAGVKLAEWTYDTVRKGQQASSTRWSGGAAYTKKVDFYDNLNRPTRTTVLVPAAEGALAPVGGYTFSTVYNPDGTLQSTGSPAAGGLPAEVIAASYDELGRPLTASSNLSSYVVGTDYSRTGKLLAQRLDTGADGKQVDFTYSYEFGSQRLRTLTTVHEGAAGVDRSETYGYDDAGNVTQIADASRDGADNQCFRYDHLARLTEAWAQGSGGCAADPAAAVLGGPAPYHDAYTYDAAGDRTGETRYDAANQPSATRAYTYAGDDGAAAGLKGHQLGAVTQTGPGARAESYAYDAAGNTTTRRIGTSAQTLTWDAEGELAKVSDPGKGETSFVYDADGGRLLRRDPGGTTLYLDGMEVRLNKGATATVATRYYTQGDQVVAVRSTTGVTFLAADRHGTGEVAIDARTGAVVKRRLTPFGQPRGSAAAGWPGDKGFVGGTVDVSTGLTHLGAREYDPDTGRFISVDPVFNADNPAQLNGYGYAESNPATNSDPSGECSPEGGCATNPCHPTGGFCGGFDGCGGTCPHHPDVSGGGNYVPRSPGEPEHGGYRTWKRTLKRVLKMMKVLTEYDALTAGACVAAWTLTCDTWSHYRGKSGKDFIVDPYQIYSDNEGIGKRVDQVMRSMAKKAIAKCRAATCELTFDSFWKSAHVSGKDKDTYYTLGGSMFRADGKFLIENGDNPKKRVITAQYTLRMHKDWNFDPNDAASVPILNRKANFRGFYEMHLLGYAREFVLRGSTSMNQSWHQ
ncbi:RHS repeat-associated core domain-containing protein [Nonomuraea sp. NPDC049607]|uniref:RHS repeat domain-containing protein n=1 Tax=Nonomuraea sp. NPDC049607 TaxID=3154732 RepID=UPI00342BB645